MRAQLCCHPFLCRGLEEHIAARAAASARSGAAPPTELEALVAASGKMVLLNKLLPKLRAEGHKVRVGFIPCCGERPVQANRRLREALPQETVPRLSASPGESHPKNPKGSHPEHSRHSMAFP